MKRISRHITWPIMVALLCAGCSRTVDVPRQQFEAEAQNESATHRIATRNGDEYLVERYSIAATALVIEVLAPDDPRRHKVELPISLVLDDVISIKRIEYRPPLYVVGIGVAAFIGVIALISEGDAFTD